ncbi:MAG: hypothetical protein H7A25_21275 [Leptospiraceae bacterium]|nr:hypothetical protein [Leptospiraceae bacterium]MCP5502443.1 hypothetical protein [Leptospiraceae bacterium]
MKPKIKKSQNIKPELMQFIDKMGLFYESLAIPRIGGRIAGLMLVIDKPISASEIAAILQVSKSSVSSNIRMLLLSGVAEIVRLTGERKDYYIFSDDFLIKSLEVKMNNLHKLGEITEDGISILNQSRLSARKLEEMKEWIQLEKKHNEQFLNEWMNTHKRQA